LDATAGSPEPSACAAPPDRAKARIMTARFQLLMIKGAFLERDETLVQ
jgi:hypothetical protein